MLEEEEEGDGTGSAGGLSMGELVQREVEALRAVDGVTSVTAKDRTNLRKPINSIMAKVRLQGRDDPLTVHCSQHVPDLLAAVQKVTAALAAIVGEDAIAEGRRRAEAAPTAAPAAPPRARCVSSAQPQSFFGHSRRIQQLQAQLSGTEALVLAADRHLKVALLHVQSEEKALAEQQARLRTARAAADAEKVSLLEAQATAASLCAELDELRGKRQRVAEPVSYTHLTLPTIYSV